MINTELLLIYPGFGVSSGVAHVVAASNGGRRALVGDPEDNPGTSVTNALERVAAAVSEHVFDGNPDFVLYEYVPRGLPSGGPTFTRIDWRGAHPFAMPTWTVVDPADDRWLNDVSKRVPRTGYTIDWIRSRTRVTADARRSHAANDHLAWLLES